MHDFVSTRNHGRSAKAPKGSEHRTRIQKRHASSRIPRKKKCGIGLSREDKRYNHALASERISVEHVIGRLKRFRIIADRYRNRRKRFALRFALIAGIYNYELCG